MEHLTGSKLGKKYHKAVYRHSAYLTSMQSTLCAWGALQKERGSGTSLSKAEGSRGEVSLLSANPAPRQARDNQTRQSDVTGIPSKQFRFIATNS